MSKLKSIPKYPINYTPQTIKDTIDYLNYLRLFNNSKWVILQFHYKSLTIQYKAFGTYIQILRVTEINSRPIDKVVNWGFTESSIAQFKKNLEEFFQSAKSTYLSD